MAFLAFDLWQKVEFRKIALAFLEKNSRFQVRITLIVGTIIILFLGTRPRTGAVWGITGNVTTRSMMGPMERIDGCRGSIDFMFLPIQWPLPRACSMPPPTGIPEPTALNSKPTPQALAIDTGL